MSPSSGQPSICIVSHKAYGAMRGGVGGSIGGVEWQTSLTARWFTRQGYRVSMLTWDEGNPGDEEIDGVRIIKICRRTAGAPGLRFFHPKWTGLVKAMRKANADLYYHNCGECVTGQIALWCRANGRAFVFSAANDTDCDPALPELRGAHERILYRRGLRSATRRIVQTQRQRAALLNHFGVDSEVIPMPCPAPPEEAGAARLRPPSERVLWLARVCRQKRPDRLLELAQACPEIHFDMAGPVYEDAYAQDVWVRARKMPNVTAHGGLPRHRVHEIQRRASLLCCTSDFEGFPNTFLEAWSVGMPIVSTFDPDGLIAQRQLGCVAHDVPGLRQAIVNLLRSPAEYHAMSHNARRYYVENHTVEAVLPRFERVFLDSARIVKQRRASKV